MKKIAAILIFVCEFASAASARTLRVRIWWQHPPAQLRLHGFSGAGWRPCTACADHSLNASDITALGSRLTIDGSPSSRILVAGEYELFVDGTRTHLAWPAEIRARAGRLAITVTIPLEDYVAGVLAGEAGGIRSEAALDALAIAARTYAVRFQRAHAPEGFDLCDTTHCQNLRLSGISQQARDSVARTEGELLWYEGEPAATYYHRSCGGEIEEGTALAPTRAPYLRAHSDEYCIRQGHDEWRGEVLKRELGPALRREGIHAPADVHSIGVIGRTPGGRAQNIRLNGDESAVVAASRFRLAVGREFGWDVIRSDAYDVSDSGDRFVFFGRGQGHGVGLCQQGAMVMAAEGKSAREILAYYFPGAQIGVNARGLRWVSLADEHVQLLTTDPNQDKQLAAEASRALRDVEQRTGWTPSERPVVRIYPGVAAFRDSTGEPGWVAASTRGSVVRLQPGSVLRSYGILEQTLRHEFAHILIEQHASRESPLWFREGLALYIAEPHHAGGSTLHFADYQLENILRNPRSEQQLRAAYRDARTRVAMLIDRQNIAAVLNWLEVGIPPQLSEFRSAANVSR